MTEHAEKREERVAFVIGLAFWVIIGAVLVFIYFRSDQAEIFINVTATPDVSVSGVAQFDGKPVSSGNVHVVVYGAKSDRYLGGAVIPLESGGRFEAKGLPIGKDEDDAQTLRVTATLSGLMQEDKKTKGVSGKATAHLNFTPPWGTLGLVMLGGVAVGLLWLIYLFTSKMTTRGKGRLLFGTMYFMTFLSLAVPVGMTLWFSQNMYMKDLAASAPMGLILGTAPGTNGVQWLVNIGGEVPRQPPRRHTAGEPTQIAALAAPGSARAQAVADGKNGPGAADHLKRIEAPSAAADDGSIHGGLVVPLYVVLLAMFGAGINMTRKVPEIQKRYEAGSPEEVKSASFLSRPLEATGKMLQGPFAQQPGTGACEMREELIRNYMYLLSAPLLAIAVYYLLQVIAKGVNQPVLVLMSFATGLTSELIVSAIITFADRMLDTMRKPKALVAVPRLLGLDLETAGAALAQAKLDLGAKSEQPSSTSTPGTVIGQEPRGGDLVASETAVKLIIAKRPQVQVPHLLGLTRDDALLRLVQMGLAGSIREEASAAQPGTVTAQSLAAGTAADPGTVVSLSVSKPAAPGPAPVAPVVGTATEERRNDADAAEQPVAHAETQVAPGADDAGDQRGEAGVHRS